MELKFKNINPCLLLDKIIEAGISAKNVTVKNDCKEDESIAENVTVTCLGEDIETIKEIAENLDNVEKAEIKQTTEDYLINLDYRISKLEMGAE